MTELAPPPGSMAVWGAVNDTSHLTGDGAVETFVDELHAAAPAAADVMSISSVFNAPPVDGYRNEQLRGQQARTGFRPVQGFLPAGDPLWLCNFVVAACAHWTGLL